MFSVQAVRCLKGEVRRCVASLENSAMHWDKPNKFQIQHVFYSLFWLELAIERFNIMARGKSQEKKEFVWKGFVNVALTEEMAADFEAWDVHDGDVFEHLAGAIASGYKFSVTETSDRTGVQVSCTGTQYHKTNHGLVVTCFAPTVYEAFRLSLFKINVVMPSDWNTMQKNGSAQKYG